MRKEHRYHVSTSWTGNLGRGTEDYRAYSRNHEIAAANKSSAIAGSSDSHFRGDTARYSPEELLVGSLSACHMLWVLHLSADSGIVITEYVDHAEAIMRENSDGSGEFIRVVLRPRVVIRDAGRMEDARSMHHRAHEMCFIARSVNFPVDHEPEIIAGTE